MSCKLLSDCIKIASDTCLEVTTLSVLPIFEFCIEFRCFLSQSVCMRFLTMHLVLHVEMNWNLELDSLLFDYPLESLLSSLCEECGAMNLS